MEKKRFLFILLLLTLCFPISTFAETILLKSGKTVEGKLIEKTNNYIKIDFQGVSLTYYFDEIDSIDGVNPALKSAQELDFSKEKNLNESIDKNKVTEEILEISGTKKQLEQDLKLKENQYAEEFKTNTDPETYALILNSIQESYNSDLANKVIADTLKENFDQKHFQDILEWLRSPLSKKITQLEVEFLTPASQQRFQDFSKTVISNPAFRDRIVLMQRLDSAKNETRKLIEIATNTYAEITKATEAALPKDRRIKDGVIETEARDMKTRLQQPVKDAVLIKSLYAYRSLSNEELEQYIKFLESDIGSWFSKIVEQGIIKANAQANKAFGNKLTQILLQELSKKDSSLLKNSR